MSLNREFPIWKERGRGEIGRGRGREGEVERERERETYKQRDRADNKNPEQSRVAQLVIYISKTKSHKSLLHFK
jgi:hypothetical protein